MKKYLVGVLALITVTAYAETNTGVCDIDKTSSFVSDTVVHHKTRVHLLNSDKSIARYSKITITTFNNPQHVGNEHSFFAGKREREKYDNAVRLNCSNASEIFQWTNY